MMENKYFTNKMFNVLSILLETSQNSILEYAFPFLFR